MGRTQLNSVSLPLRPSCFLGVLWLCIVAESLYLSLLFTGGALMILELCPWFSIMNKLKLSAFAAMCTALSGNKHCFIYCFERQQLPSSGRNKASAQRNPSRKTLFRGCAHLEAEIISLADLKFSGQLTRRLNIQKYQIAPFGSRKVTQRSSGNVGASVNQM